MLYQSEYQINGTHAHENVDNATYSDRKEILMATDVYSEKYRLVGKIDIFDTKSGRLRERKKKIKTIYDGYVFQVYAQCVALREMGYAVKQIELYSMDDHKTYRIPLPEEDLHMFNAFEKLIEDMRLFRLEEFKQSNVEKCRKCIYEPACDRSLVDSEK